MMWVCGLVMRGRVSLWATDLPLLSSRTRHRCFWCSLAGLMAAPSGDSQSRLQCAPTCVRLLCSPACLPPPLRVQLWPPRVLTCLPSTLPPPTGSFTATPHAHWPALHPPPPRSFYFGHWPALHPQPSTLLQVLLRLHPRAHWPALHPTPPPAPISATGLPYTHNPPPPRRFYYGHPACLYINKLRVAGVLEDGIDPFFEQVWQLLS